MAKKEKKKKLPSLSGASIFSSEALAFAASASKLVTFSCTSATCLVSIQLGVQRTSFVGPNNGRMMMTPGGHLITIQVQGAAGTPFSVTATNATMVPFSGSASLSAVVPITV